MKYKFLLKPLSAAPNFAQEFCGTKSSFFSYRPKNILEIDIFVPPYVYGLLNMKLIMK